MSIAICSNTSSGWGWENGQVCISASSCGRSSSTPAPTSPPADFSGSIDVEFFNDGNNWDVQVDYLWKWIIQRMDTL
ncbi:MAG: hypothetical protein JXB88_00765 [Spirochaetales bacterium]|nr:hypothetical protein [Spirochaetales bacterium]